MALFCKVPLFAQNDDLNLGKPIGEEPNASMGSFDNRLYYIRQDTYPTDMEDIRFDVVAKILSLHNSKRGFSLSSYFISTLPLVINSPDTIYRNQFPSAKKEILSIDTVLYDIQPTSATIVFSNSRSIGSDDAVFRRGVCYSEASVSRKPTRQDKSIPFREGSIFQVIDQLVPATRYCVRAFTEYKDGTVDYSETVSFVTALYLKTTPVTDIGATSASVGGEIVFNIPEKIIQVGVCWSLKSDQPTTNNRHTGDVVTNGRWQSSMLNLNPDTEYFVRTYVMTEGGTVHYGNVVRFRTKAE